MGFHLSFRYVTWGENEVPINLNESNSWREAFFLWEFRGIHCVGVPAACGRFWCIYVSVCIAQQIQLRLLCPSSVGCLYRPAKCFTIYNFLFFSWPQALGWQHKQGGHDAREAHQRGWKERGLSRLWCYVHTSYACTAIARRLGDIALASLEDSGPGGACVPRWSVMYWTAVVLVDGDL